jgi:hypothetical protein
MAVREHTLVGIFPSSTGAAGAVRSLEARGFDPSDVEIVGDDAGAASEVAARTYARAGFFVGLAIGLVLALAAAFIGGLARYPTGALVGAFWIVGGFAVVGLVLGREVVRRAPDAPLFAEAVRQGGAVVAVSCGDRCDVAERVLDEAGAAAVRDETPESI